MKYDLLLENWNNFLNEQEATSTTAASAVQTADTVEKPKEVAQSEEEKKQTKIKSIKDLAIKYLNDIKRLSKQLGVDYGAVSPEITKQVQSSAISESKKKKKGKDDRCTRIAKSKYDTWPSAYASGAVVRCRRGEIWKGISEDATDEEIAYHLLLEELETIEETLLNERCWKGYTQKGMKTMFGKKYPNCVKKTNEEIEDQELETIEEEWSDKYKRSIDCNNPKGFSQKAHCQGRKKNEEIVFDTIELLEEETIEEAKKKRPYKPNFSREKKQGLHGWFSRNKGKGWINCRTGGPCGRSSSDKKGGKYPACRPTKAQCKAAGRGPLRKKKSSKPISWVKKKKKD